MVYSVISNFDECMYCYKNNNSRNKNTARIIRYCVLIGNVVISHIKTC